MDNISRVRIVFLFVFKTLKEFKDSVDLTAIFFKNNFIAKEIMEYKNLISYVYR